MIHALVDRRQTLQGIDWVQVRAKELEARPLLELVRWYLAQSPRVIVNSRTDVAIVAGAAGVHLPAGSPDPRRVRKLAPPGFLIGVSCHSRAELEQAEQAGADYAYLSPVFPSRSKADCRPPLGLDGFARLVSGLSIPVLALGGLRREHLADCQAAGAAGIAGISLARDEH